jgi:hypothetical protein
MSFIHAKSAKISPNWVIKEGFYAQNITEMRLFGGKIAAQPRKYRVRNGGRKKKSKIPIY